MADYSASSNAKRKRLEEEIVKEGAIRKELETAIASIQESMRGPEGNTFKNKKTKTPRGRINQYIAKDIMSALRHGDVEVEENEKFTSPFKAFLQDEVDAKQLPFGPFWDDIWGTVNQFFIFENRLSGHYLNLPKSKRNAAFDALADELGSPTVAAHAKEIGFSLPFPFYSMFVDHQTLHYINNVDLILVSYNADLEKAKRYMSADEENGKIAYNPYFVLMDKFSAEFLKTGSSGPLWSQATVKNAEGGGVKINALTHLMCFVLADIYPHGHPEHEQAMEIRKQIIIETNKGLKEYAEVERMALAIVSAQQQGQEEGALSGGKSTTNDNKDEAMM